MLESQLQQLGFTEKEAQVYLALLQIGTNAVTVIARKANQTRTTTYAVLESLRKKGFVHYFEKNKSRYYSAERPEIILTLLDRKIRETNIQRKKMENLMPEFRALIDQSSIIPQVHYFEGLDGIKKIYQDTLQAQEKLSYSCAPDVKGELREFLDAYIKQRLKKGISTRAIFPDTAKSRLRQTNNDLNALRLVPADRFPFTCEINIYANKVAYISLDPTNYHGVIIQSSQIAETERSIFELAWMGAARAV